MIRKKFVKTELPLIKIEPKTEHQRDFLRSLAENVISFGLGVAGSGKSYLSIGWACEKLINDDCDSIILTKPFIECSEVGIGWLKGDLNSKIAPYLLPITEYLNLFLGVQRTAKLIEEDRIKILPLEYSRGCTFHDSIIIVEEAQNCTFSQLKMILTRIGTDSKILISGDPKQTDLYGKMESGLQRVADKLKGLEEVGIVNFTIADIQRHHLIGKILSRLES